VALGQDFSEYIGFPCQFSLHRLLHKHHLSSGTGTIGQLVADVPSGLSLTPLQETEKETTRHELPVDGAGLRGLGVHSMNSSSDYFAYLCIPASETTLHQKRMPTADRSQLQRHAAEINSKNEPWIVWLQGVDYGCFTRSKLQQLCYCSCTRL
jgi:hypothetical protein